MLLKTIALIDSELFISKIYEKDRICYKFDTLLQKYI